MTDRFNTALKTLVIFSEIGLTLSPAYPTDHMCHIGAKIGNVDLETAKKIYRFMVDAALDPYSKPEDEKTKKALGDYLKNLSSKK